MADSDRNSTRSPNAEFSAHGDAEPRTRPAAKPGPHSRAEPASRVQAIVAVVTENDFVRARALLHGFAKYSDYEEYRLFRESLQIGLELAGVETTMLPLRLSALLEWRDMSEPFAGESGLEACFCPGGDAADAHDLWVGTLQ